ncbi:hypothetical protein NLG97_g2031 [Lecanicillium saksenae]|uniref:Uncharacterized protein n=1 Tax=Lecanicillium saksenae TaxID=468837 RepID=A0ACC1R4R0_9HYPO|nr:hypothetical protein NLG97_g2031 [Lecanicillium saksenae]
MGAFTFILIGPLSSSDYSTAPSRSLAALLRKLDSSSRIVDLIQNNTYTSLDHQFDRLWNEDMLPPNGGYLKTDKETNNTDMLGISMFHQLHCLGMIREEMQHLHQIINDLNTGGSGDMTTAKDHRRKGRRHSDGLDLDAGRPAHHDQKHTMHCFDYLRQTILRLADSTIERPKVFPDGTPYVDGQAQRRCKNWDILQGASANSDDEPISDDELR